MSEISVVVATFGEQRWAELAASRAVPSALSQGCEVTVVHQPDGSAASARNEGAQRVSGTHIVFLDADDELGVGYVAAMRDALPPAVDSLVVPEVQYIGRTGRPQGVPFFYPEVDVRRGNWMVIGTMVPRDVFLEVGGFDDRWPIYEDWCLWARCVEMGCVPVKAPGAVYRAWRTPGSRNHSRHRLQRVYWHQRIGAAIWPALYDQTTGEEDAREMLLRPNGRPLQTLRFVS